MMTRFLLAAVVAAALPASAMAQDALGFTHSPPSAYTASSMPQPLNSLPQGASTGSTLSVYPSRTTDGLAGRGNPGRAMGRTLTRPLVD
ncbi:MAG: hypothetical protein ACRYG6_01260 [Janthinobacterium lividum]